jgi:hypothetical protein
MGDDYQDVDDINDSMVPESGVDPIPTLPFPDISQMGGGIGDVPGMTAKETLQQAFNAAWWLGYWTAMHSQKVGICGPFVSQSHDRSSSQVAMQECADGEA